MRIAPNIWRSAQGLGRERLFMLSTLTLGHVIVHWYQQLFSLITPALKNDLGLSNVDVGTLSTARMFTNLLTLPSGFISDSYRNQNNLILALAILSFGLGYFFIGTASSFSWAIFAATLIGLGSALWHPAAIGSLSVRFREARGMALSIHGAGASVGDSIAPVIVGGVLLVMNWRVVMQFHLLPAIVVAIALWWGLRKTYSDDAPKPSLRDYAAGIKGMVTNVQILGVTGSSAVSGMARQAVTVFFPIYVSETLGYSTFVLGIYLALLYVMGLISQPIMGAVSDRVGRKVVLVVSFATMAVLFSLMIVVPGGLWLGIVITALGCFFYGTVNISQSAVMDVAGERVQSSTMGVMSLLSQPFTLASPIIIGFLVEGHGLMSAFWYAAILQAISTLILLPIKFRRAPTRQGGGHS
ncbi:MAG: MFS transporter [Dehalococcoidia bacterium]|nr:MFS transporter [Dehalococcoidia bacterium]